MTPRQWLIALTAIALAVRIPGLNDGLWFDEIVTVLLSVRQPFLSIVTEYPWNNVHPAYSVLAHAAVVTFGEAAWTLRLPAMIFGAASVPLTYAVARAMGLHREALWSAALVALSQHHVWFSQSARGYTMLGFFALLGTWLLLGARRDPRPRTFAGYGVSAALGAYTHLTMGFIVAAQALVAGARVVLSPERSQLRVWTGLLTAFGLAGVLTLALYAPLLRETTAFFASAPASGARVATTSWAALELLRGLGAGFGAIGLVLGALLGIAGGLRCLRDDWEATLLMTLPSVVTLAGTVAMQRPIFPRFFFFQLAFAMIFIARGGRIVAEALAARRTRAGPAAATRMHAVVMAVLVAISAAMLPDAYGPKQDYAGAMAYLEGARAPQDVVLTAGLAALPYGQYFRTGWIEATDETTLRAARSTTGSVWIVYTFPRYLAAMNPEIEAIVQRECPAVRTFPGTVRGGDVIVCRLTPAR